MRARHCVLFDLDGTLVDSRVVVARHWALFAERHGVPLEPILEVCHGRRTADTVAEVAPWLDADEAAAVLDAGEEEDVDGLVAVPGAAELLAVLPPTSWAVVTSAHRALARRRLAAVGLPQPDVMVCGDEVGAGKPDPEGFLRAAERLGVEGAACVVLEDAPAGVEAGVRAGAAVIGVSVTHAAAVLVDAGASVVVADLAAARAPLRVLGVQA